MTPSRSTVPRTRGAIGVAVRSLALLAVPVALAAGPPPPALWVATYDGQGQPFATDVLMEVAVNAGGEICAAGGSVVTGGAFAAATVFFESDGSERWRRLYVAPGSGGNEQALSVFLDDAGHCRVAGQASVADSPSTGLDVLVLEYDPQGDLLWSATHDGAGAGIDVAVDVTADAAGNVYVAALSAGDGSDWDILALKYDAAGNELWARRFDGPAGGDDEPVGVAVDAAGHVYVAGTASVRNPFGDDLVVIKYDADGGELWTELIDGGAEGADRAAALALDADGDPYVAGRLLTPPGAEWQAAVVKLLPDGSHDWTGVAGHPAAGIPEVVRALEIGAGGGAYLLATGSNDVLTARFAPGGTLLWDELHDGVSIPHNATHPLAVDQAGNAYVAASDSFAGRGVDFLTYRLEAADGAVAWEQPFGEEGEEADDRPVAVVVDPTGGILVGGTVRPGGVTFEDDWAIVKYAVPLFADGFESGDTGRWSAGVG